MARNLLEKVLVDQGIISVGVLVLWCAPDHISCDWIHHLLEFSQSFFFLYKVLFRD
jgi:hypothetical protein